MNEGLPLEALFIKAKEVLEQAYAPYSQIQVGAAILGSTGKIYTGVNVENSSYGLTICAERTALFKGISEGEREFEAIAIVSSNKKPVVPCGACCQVLAEFNPKMLIVMSTLNGEKSIKNLTELFPYPFSTGK